MRPKVGVKRYSIAGSTSSKTLCRPDGFAAFIATASIRPAACKRPRKKRPSGPSSGGGGKVRGRCWSTRRRADLRSAGVRLTSAARTVSTSRSAGRSTDVAPTSAAAIALTFSRSLVSVAPRNARRAESNRLRSVTAGSCLSAGILSIAWRSSSMAPDSLSRQAGSAVGDVVEGICPLCRVGLGIHDDRACCPCCGDSYRAGPSRLEMHRCAEHGRDCQHWHAVWASRPNCT
jgi:hypothetical protein